MLEKFLSAISIIFLIFCMLTPLKRTAPAQKHRPLKWLTRLHTPCGILLLITGLCHGILAGSSVDGNTPAMITGKLTWMLLLLLAILALPKRKTRHTPRRNLHIILAVSVFISTVVHAGFAAIF